MTPCSIRVSVVFALAAVAALAGAGVPDAKAEDARTGAASAPMLVAQSEPRAASRPAGKPPSTRLPDTGTPPAKPRPVLCIGGRVVRGACICPRGTRLAGITCRPRPGVSPRDPSPDPKPDAPGRAPPSAPPAAQPSGSSSGARPRHPALTPPSGPARIAPGPPPLAPGRVIGATDVFLADEIVALAAAGAPAGVGGDVAGDFGLVLLDEIAVALTGDRMLRFRIPDGRDVETVIAALAADPRIEGPQQNFVYRAQQGAAARPAPSDLQYALAKVDLAGAHALATGAGVLVAVIDSGVDAAHPDLSGAVEAEIDISGSAPRKGSAADPHGTAIAGIIAAHGLVRGIAPAARILSLRAFTPGLAGAAATATTAILVVAMDQAMGRGAAILNMSFAGPADPLLHRLVKAVAAKGGMVVAAAGNKGPDAPPVYPGGYAEVISVTATDAADRIYVKANRGPYITVAAPGVDVLAPGVAKSHQMQSGTSFAAAHVSGILALMRERVPDLALDAARTALTAAAVDLGAPGPDAEFGAGLVSAKGALDALGTSRR